MITDKPESSEVPRVILVDDDRGILEVVRILLSSAGIEVHSFNRARDAVRALDSVRPHLLITDNRMPGMTGVELVGELQRNHSHVPVVLMTAQASDDFSGVIGLYKTVKKPFDNDDLINTVADAVRHGMKAQIAI